MYIYYVYRHQYLVGNLGNVKEKPTREICFYREKKRLAPRIYLAKFCWEAFL